ncbi:CTD small phosphatase-like protein 2 isoform X5 [Scyliorhinus canicula]|uniref:CTD small phosphatase-like protein 2 isoform X5 n=1 Tax=Scyliorhinus canicula TaxID=7830 RepID=UPI0018F5FEB4|nr:CTD small phosphatase-like protein 2 isoform X5 [Scyliorhinus canicula]
MNLRSGKAIAVVPLTPRTPNCIKGQNRALRAPLQKQFGNILKTAHSTKKTSQKNPEKPASSVTFDPDLSGECPNQSDLFTTTPRATRLTGRHRHSTELNREFEYAPGATKLNIWVQFGDECQRLVTRGNAKAKRARALFPISPSVSRDLETSWGLEDDSDPMEVTFSINFSVDASCHCIESEDFNQHKLIKDLQSSIKMTLQKSILPLKTRSVPNHSLVLGLDETLVHCQLTAMENVEFVFPVQFQDKSYQVYVRLRPYCKEFLENLSQFYEIILFTTATKDYADKLVDILDPQRRMISKKPRSSSPRSGTLNMENAERKLRLPMGSKSKAGSKIQKTRSCAGSFHSCRTWPIWMMCDLRFGEAIAWTACEWRCKALHAKEPGLKRKWFSMIFCSL